VDSVSDPKRLIPDQSWKGFPDPDPTLQVFPDPVPDPGQNLTSLTKLKEKFFLKSCRNVIQWDCSTVFAIFLSI